MMDYLSREQEEQEGPIPSRLQEHFQQSSYQGYRVPESSLYDSKPAQDPYSNRKTISGLPPRPARPSVPRPPVPRPPVPRPQKIAGFNTGPPKMEFFGPKDYVPEQPHLIQGVQVYPQSQRRIETPYPENKSNYLILEPKPRSLHRLDVIISQIFSNQIVLLETRGIQMKHLHFNISLDFFKIWEG